MKEVERLSKENTELFFKLEGVMWSVDKWLEGDELKQDEVNRAITMREKTLRIVESQQAEIERLKKRSILNGLKVVNKERKQIKSEAIKEFAKRLMDEVGITPVDDFNYAYVIRSEEIDNLVKEMTEGCEK